jgi:hypothetical protein
VAALGEEIRQHPDASPVLLNNPAYVGVAVTSLPGRSGFHRVRTPQVDHHQVAAIIHAATGLRRDPAVLLGEQAPGLRVVPDPPTPGQSSPSIPTGQRQPTPRPFRRPRGGRRRPVIGAEPAAGLSWPRALRAVQAWLIPWSVLARCWRSWSPAPPPRQLQRLLDAAAAGQPLHLYLPP